MHGGNSFGVAYTGLPAIQGTAFTLSFPPQITDLAFQNRHQSFDDFLAPVLRLTVYETAKLRNGNRYSDVFQLPCQFRHRTHIAFGHQHANAPHNGTARRRFLLSHVGIVVALQRRHKSLHAVQHICDWLLQCVISMGILCVIEWRDHVFPAAT